MIYIKNKKKFVIVKTLAMIYLKMYVKRKSIPMMLYYLKLHKLIKMILSICPYLIHQLSLFINVTKIANKPKIF